MFMHFGVHELSYTVGVLHMVVWSTDQLPGYMINIWTLEKTQGKVTRMSRQLFFKESCCLRWGCEPTIHVVIGWLQYQLIYQGIAQLVEFKSPMQGNKMESKCLNKWNQTQHERDTIKPPKIPISKLSDWHSDRQGKANPWTVIFQRNLFALGGTWTHNPQIHGMYIIYVHVCIPYFHAVVIFVTSCI